MTSNDHMNGQAAAPAVEPKPEDAHAAQKTAAEKARAMLDAQVRQVLGITIRGLLVSAPGTPADELLRSVSRVTGSICAGAVQADLVAMITMRKSIKEAFDDGVNKTPVNALAAPPSPAAEQTGQQ